MFWRLKFEPDARRSDDGICMLRKNSSKDPVRKIGSSVPSSSHKELAGKLKELSRLDLTAD
jgi:hypothetical protein